jgi:hypothetical protein
MFEAEFDLLKNLLMEPGFLHASTGCARMASLRNHIYRIPQRKLLLSFILDHEDIAAFPTYRPKALTIGTQIPQIPHHLSNLAASI